MNRHMKIVYNSSENRVMPDCANLFTLENTAAVRNFHRTVPGYAPTPLISLRSLAGLLGVNSIFVKDESSRFGLNAFKGLGGSYCIARCIAERLRIDPERLTYQELIECQAKSGMDCMTFVTATDGNHGRGVAWMAQALGHKSVVYMPEGSSVERLENIRKLGAEAYITDMNYDDTVRMAASEAKGKNRILVQDTAWKGYEIIPSYIMQGYTTMAFEIGEQLKQYAACKHEKKSDNSAPTHIFLQAGVGAMAGAVAAYFRSFYGEGTPVKIIIVEPDKADCIYRTAEAADGNLHKISGEMNTIMAGLACGEPCLIGWDILEKLADAFISMSDDIAAKGMRTLAAPTGNDSPIVSGESGAAGIGALLWIMQREDMDDERRRLGLGKDSRILCISTEGATDIKNYRSIVWDGLYPSFNG